MTKARRIVLARHPQGMPGHDNLKLEEFGAPAPGDGEVALRTIHLSLDPYMRGRMSPAKSYAAGVGIGETMTGETVSEVTDSRHPGFAKGDIVLGRGGWATHAALPGAGLRKLDPAAAPLVTALGVLGMPGFTAFCGLKLHGRPKPGETVVVSAASGAVGQIVGQLAKIEGCRAVGIAGGPEKCEMVTGMFGFDACVDYKSPGFREALAAACPAGIDIYFENVAGGVLEAVVPLLNDFARMPVCGTIAYYNMTSLPQGADMLPMFMRAVLVKRLSVRGFINYDHIELHDEFLERMGAWVREGRVRHVEDIVQGLENAVDAFRGLLTGANKGKLIVQVGPEPGGR
jgi:NADPH-dependent curcumin reductase CurA